MRLSIQAVLVLSSSLALSVGCPSPALTEQAGCEDLLDEDEDGFPKSNPQFLCCDDQCSGLTDCNDQDPDVHPADFDGDTSDDPVEIDGDGIDSNCDGQDAPPL